MRIHQVSKLLNKSELSDEYKKHILDIYEFLPLTQIEMRKLIDILKMNLLLSSLSYSEVYDIANDVMNDYP